MREKSEQERRHSSLRAPSDLGKEASRSVSARLNVLLADVFVLYLKTKKLPLACLRATLPRLSPASRWTGGSDLRDNGCDRRACEKARLDNAALNRPRLAVAAARDNDGDYVAPLDMLSELRDDNLQLAAHLREAHEVCEEHGDFASASCI